MMKEEGSPATLVAIAVAGHRTGDRDLESQARRELDRQYGITLRFRRNQQNRRESPVEK